MKKFLFVSLIVLVIINIFIVVKNLNIAKNNHLISSSSITQELNVEDYFFYFNYLTQSENFYLDTSIILVDEENNSFHLNEIFNGEENYIIVRLYKNSCGICIEEELDRLYHYFMNSNINLDHVYLITPFANEKIMHFFKERLDFNLNLYYCDYIELTFDSINLIYLFTTDNTLIINNFFVPKLLNEEFTSGYVRMLSLKI